MPQTNNKRKNENRRRQELARNLQDIVLDPNDTRLAFCNRSYGDTHIQILQNLEISRISYPETVEKLRGSQIELNNKRIQFSEWNLYLGNHCCGNVYVYCLDQRRNTKPWTEIIMSMFQGMSFEIMNSK